MRGAITVLALDMYEHAYHLDFGPNTVAYVATFMRNIDWSAVQGRYEDAVGVKPPRPLEQKQFGDLPSVKGLRWLDHQSTSQQVRRSTAADPLRRAFCVEKPSQKPASDDQ